MRIIVASPAKTGNVWVKLLLAEIYGLRVLVQAPRIPVSFLKDFIEQGHFEDNTIFHQHFRPTEPFFTIVEQVTAELVTTIRHPYDVFVSLYFYVQRLSHLFQPETKLYPLIGKDINDPSVIEYLKRDEDGFGLEVNLSLAWVESRRSILVRYEDMLADVYKVLKDVTGKIRPVSDDKIQQAINLNRAENLRKKSEKLNQHIRKGTSGDWRNHLTSAHLEALNSSHGPKIMRLGYELHDTPNS